jgi:hypothetical protein
MKSRRRLRQPPKAAGLLVTKQFSFLRFILCVGDGTGVSSRTSRIRPLCGKSFWRKLLIYKGEIILVTVNDGLNCL